MAISKKTIKDINIQSKRILMRVDFNVPLKNGVIQDDTRIKSALPTIKYVLENGAKSLVLMSHLGDPSKDIKKAKEKAEKDGVAFDEKKFSDGKHKMAPVAEHLSKLLGKPVKTAASCLGEETAKMAASLNNGEILLLENTRFHKEEKAKDEAEQEVMAKQLAKYGDIFVNDAFGTAHRAHASTATVAKFLPAVAGFLMEKELEYLMEKVVKSPARPFIAIVGGAKVSSKIGVIESLLTIADKIIIGGGMAYTFYKAQGYEIGKSLVEDDQIDTAKKILSIAKEKNIKLILPVDNVCGKQFAEDTEIVVANVQSIPSDVMGLDIGPKTIDIFKQEISGAKTVFWNGPVGVFEMDKFAKGTIAIAELLATLSGATTVIGGGDSVSAVNKAGVASKMSHISTGGGASLELVEGKNLPGVEALLDK